MTREEAIKSALKFLVRKQQEQGSWGYADNDDTHEVSWDEIIEWIDQQPCETIKEIPKYYKYDTETKDFLVYRHMYTGHEIHIEKPVPRYKLEQQPCEDCVDRNTLLSKATVLSDIDSNMNIVNHEVVYVKDIKELPSVEPERKTGKWEWDQRTGEYVCSECGCNPIYERTTPDVSEIDKYRYCRWCGAPMEVDTSTEAGTMMD